MEKNLKVATVCPVCDQSKIIVVNEREFIHWKTGELIQRAMPSLSAADREALITGYCDPCFNRIWGEEE
jgi:hypothetical protein